MERLRLNPQTKPGNCEKHGNVVFRSIDGVRWLPCPKCAEEAESVRREAELSRIAAERAKREQESWKNRLESAAIPPRFSDRGFHNFDAKTDRQLHALNISISYANEFRARGGKTGESMMFVGRPGTGKTHLSIAICSHIIGIGGTALFTSVQKIMREIKSTWVKGCEKSESDVTRSFVYPDLLVIDEVGVQHGTEFEKNILFSILNERYENRKPSILLSNLPADEAKLYLGERVIDRLREDGGRVVAFDWDSHRGK